MTSAQLPSTWTTIPNGIFIGCSSLTSVTIPAGVTSIGYSAFLGCTSLAAITIPDKVEYIGEDAFNGCENLPTINYNGTKTQWDELSKMPSWNIGCKEITLHCTDGDIIIPAYRPY